MNQKIVIHNTDYYAFNSPYFNKPRQLSSTCLRFAAKNDFETNPVCFIDPCLPPDRVRHKLSFMGEEGSGSSYKLAHEVQWELC